MKTPACPWCYGPTQVEPCTDMQEASDRSESFAATHRCTQCRRAFRHVPAEAPFNPIRVSGS